MKGDIVRESESAFMICLKKLAVILNAVKVHSLSRQRIREGLLSSDRLLCSYTAISKKTSVGSLMNDE